MPAAIEIQNLTKDYEVGFWRKRKVRALDGLSLSVEPGQIFGFLGANGAGKTTTIRMLCGLTMPTSGSAFIGGLDVWRDRFLLRSKFGYVPQSAGAPYEFGSEYTPYQADSSKCQFRGISLGPGETCCKARARLGGSASSN